MRRFIAAAEEIEEKRVILRDPDEIRHVKVLRLRPGEHVIVSDGSMFEYECRIEKIGETGVEAVILDKQRSAGEPAQFIDLYQAVPKHPKMETVIQKSVELGVSAIYPILSSRTLVLQKADVDKRQSRWQRIAAEATKQCRRGSIPPFSPALDWEELLLALKEYELVLFIYENEEKNTLKKLLRSLSGKPSQTAVLIGPEGGFSDSEAEAVLAAGGRPVSLGSAILRTETAGLAVLAMLKYEWEL
jgi:16S rRNA (uracil1498-N3)-methyltransferase